jgi:hypothetical protein
MKWNLKLRGGIFLYRSARDAKSDGQPLLARAQRS